MGLLFQEHGDFLHGYLFGGIPGHDWILQDVCQDKAGSAKNILVISG
jgi:hypothetical protein